MRRSASPNCEVRIRRGITPDNANCSVSAGSPISNRRTPAATAALMRVTTAAHRNVNHEIRDLKQLLGEAALLAPNHECRWESVAQRFVVEQSGRRRSDNCHSAGFCPIHEFAGRALCQLLRKQRIHRRTHRGGIEGVAIRAEGGATSRRAGTGFSERGLGQPAYYVRLSAVAFCVYLFPIWGGSAQEEARDRLCNVQRCCLAHLRDSAIGSATR